MLVMLKECVVMSLSNILSNKLRSFLTVLGILIGVSAVIALITTVSSFSGERILSRASWLKMPLFFLPYRAAAPAISSAISLHRLSRFSRPRS